MRETDKGINDLKIHVNEIQEPLYHPTARQFRILMVILYCMDVFVRQPSIDTITRYLGILYGEMIHRSTTLDRIKGLISKGYLTSVEGKYYPAHFGMLKVKKMFKKNIRPDIYANNMPIVPKPTSKQLMSNKYRIK